jgi:hypothetical protein
MSLDISPEIEVRLAVRAQENGLSIDAFIERLLNAPVAIASNGGAIGYFIPARHKRSEAERTALKEAAAQLDALLAAKGVTEDELVADFKRWRAAKRR